MNRGPTSLTLMQLLPPLNVLALAALLATCVSATVVTSPTSTLTISSSFQDPKQIMLTVPSDKEAAQQLGVSSCSSYSVTPAVGFKWLANKSVRQAAQVNVGSSARLRLAMQRYKDGGNLTVAFVGGSITAGQGKSDGLAYSDWAQSILHLLLSSRVEVHNGAVGGTGSSFMAACHAVHVPQHVDIVFVEYAINDKQQHQMGSSVRRMDNPYRRPYERLVRTLLNYPNRPAVLLYHAYKHFDDKDGMNEYYASAESDYHEFALYYALPELSVKAACRDPMLAGVKGFQVHAKRGQVAGPGKLGDDKVKHYVFYADAHHPDGNTGHKVMGELAVQPLLDALEDLKMRPITEHDIAEASTTIPKPMLLANWEPATEKCFLGLNFVKSVTSKEGWEWRAEGHVWAPKYGFISEQPGKLLQLVVNSTSSGGSIDQKVNMKLAYLRSYEGMGQARVSCMSGCSCGESILEAHHTDKNSQLFTHEWVVTQADVCLVSVLILNTTSSGKHKIKLAGVMVSEESGDSNKVDVDPRAVEMVNDLAIRDGLVGQQHGFNVSVFEAHMQQA